ncbi:MAG: glutamate-1-semialdehyde 2,1-aminomutase [Actinomycetota bacterium]|nr:glutamate-1-semialdehyde 2,1-aminomutase [Actinomycetota bacterium]
MKHEQSKRLFEQAKELIPGGVNSPVRAFKSVGLDPIFIHRGKGSKIFDVDGNEYIDYVGSWGPLILGHANDEVVGAIQATIANGTSFGAPTPVEIAMARKVLEAYPSMDKVRMVNSGTEATMSAIRVARGYTKRDKIIKFIGGYHGHADYLLVQAGSGVTTLGLPDSPGVTAGTAGDTISLPYNNLAAVEETLKNNGDEIAAVILEPVAGNMGCVPPKPGFLEGLRQVTADYGVVLIFDEVMTGFRVAYGGAQERFNIDPDMTCLGKIIGGGLPVGAFGGKAAIMDNVAPAGPIYQAGTLSGNPLAMTAGLVTLQLLSEPGVYDELEVKSTRLAAGLKVAAESAGLDLTFNRVGSMSTVFFTDQEVFDFDSAKTSDTDKFAKFFGSMLEQGINIAPSQFEAGFVSLAHSDEDIDKTVEAAMIAFREI